MARDNQGYGAMIIFDGSDSGSGKAFRLRLQIKRTEGSSGSGQNVPAAVTEALAQHFLNIDPLKSIKFDPFHCRKFSVH